MLAQAMYKHEKNRRTKKPISQNGRYAIFSRSGVIKASQQHVDRAFLYSLADSRRAAWHECTTSLPNSILGDILSS